MLPMTTAQILLPPEPAHIPFLRRAAQVVGFPTQERSFPRPARVARVSSARVTRSGALPSSEMGSAHLAGGRARVLHFA